MRKLALLTLLVLASACGPSADDLVGQAKALDRDGKEDAAIAAYRRALARAPGSYDAHYGIARALDLVGNYDEARQHFAKAIELAPASSKEQAIRMMGIAWTFAGNLDEAVRAFRDVYDRRVAAANPPGAAEEANEIGRVYLELGNPDQAETWYRTGHDMAGRETSRSPAEIDLADMRWAHAQARIAARRGQTQDARRQQAIVKALVDKGGNDDQKVQYAYLAGYVDFYAKDYRAAVADLQTADQADPFILVLLGEAHEALGNQNDARECYRKALASTSHAVSSAFVRPIARRKLDPR